MASPAADLLSVAVLALDREEPVAALPALLARAARREARLVALPLGLPMEKAAFAALAAEHGLYLAAGWEEAGRRLGGLFGPDGTLLGTQAQTHALPGEPWALAETLAPIATPLGRIGLTLGSDLYFPEAHWSLAQQGADLLVHLEGERPAYDHFYSVLSPRVRALDVVRPFLIARPASRAIKIVHNEEMGIAGTPMAGSVVIDANGAVLASTGYAQGLAQADLRLAQHCISLEAAANVPMHHGNDLWRLYFNDSRARFFPALREPYAPPPKPAYRQRRVRIAILTHPYATQLGGGGILPLVEAACALRPDLILTTEMEGHAAPEAPEVAAELEAMVARAAAAGSYLIVGGLRPICEDQPPLPDGQPRRGSHAWLWDRQGRRVFESRIMLYGYGCGQGVFDTDFGRIGIRLCGDIYAPELDRLFALAGVDLVCNPSMSWAASGLINTELNQVRAMDNGHFIASAHLGFSDPGQRSHVIDPTGAVVAASAYGAPGVTLTEIDLEAPRGSVFIPEGGREVPAGSYLEAYRTPCSHRLLAPGELLRLRRPALYTALEEDRTDHPYTTRDRGDGVRL